MLKLINNSSAFYGAGLSLQRKLFKIKAGPYAGRMAAIYPTGPASIALSYSDPPYLAWSAPLAIISDSADYPAGGWMDGNGNIYVAYTAEGGLSLMHKKINFANGLWSSGSLTTICNQGANYYPSIYKDIYNRLWVSWTYASGETRSVNVKAAVDGSGQWGLGAEDPGTILASAGEAAFSRLEYLPTHIFCFYSLDGGRLAYRRFELAGSLWHSEIKLYEGSGPSDNFACAVSDDLRLGLAFVAGSDLYFKDFDGAAWSGNQLIGSGVAVAPVLKYNGAIAFIFYGREIGPLQNQLYYSYRSGAAFTQPQRVTGELAAFDKVLCYRPEALARYYDRSAEAASEAAADVFHPDSGKMLKDAGDAVLIGQSEKYSQLRINLAMAGAGGAVNWYYWNGAGWKEFAPQSGEYNFDATPALIRLWEDAAAIPGDWQSSIVAGCSKFWIRIVVSETFGTAPLGTQLTCADRLPFICAL